jgi:argininosuccinate synthase
MDPAVGVYGEGAAAWSGEEAAGFARIYGLASMLARRAEERGRAAEAEGNR